MQKDVKIREAQSRVIEVFRKKPQKALSTISAVGALEDGLMCTYTEGGHSAAMDMPEIMGGEGNCPSPGFFARAGIVGCVSIGIKQEAVRMGLILDRITVSIDVDFDDGAMFGLGDRSAAPLETRLNIRIETALPESEVIALVDRALGRDPWYLALRDAQSVECHVVVER